MDGSKGLLKAIRSVFNGFALNQRCQLHKRENVVGYLPKGEQKKFRTKLQEAYEKPTYAEAQDALERIQRELRLLNQSAARSLEEGLEETLTLHRLGLFEKLGTSFKTTNVIESIQARLGQYTDKVDYWRNSDQKQRWVAAALLDLGAALAESQRDEIFTRTAAGDSTRAWDSNAGENRGMKLRGFSSISTKNGIDSCIE